MKHIWKWIVGAFCLAVLIGILVPSRMMIHYRKINGNSSTEQLIAMLKVNGDAWWAEVDQEVLRRSEDPVMVDALKVAASDTDIDRLVHANYLLFRMRIEPEIRLQVLFDLRPD